MKNYIVNIQNENNMNIFRVFFLEMGYLESSIKTNPLSKNDIEILFEGVFYDKKKLLRTRTTKYKKNKSIIDSMNSGEFINYIFHNQDIIVDIVYSKITGRYVSGNFKNLDSLV